MKTVFCDVADTVGVYIIQVHYTVDCVTLRCSMHNYKYVHTSALVQAYDALCFGDMNCCMLYLKSIFKN